MGLSGIPGGLGCACSDAKAAASPYGVSDYVAGSGRGMAGLRGLRGLGDAMGTVIAPGLAVDPTFGTFQVDMTIPQGQSVPSPFASAPAGALTPDTSTLSSILGVPGEVTGAFGLNPLQATQLGLQFAGRGPKPIVPAPVAQGPSGTTIALVLLGLGGVGLALGMKSRAAPAKPATA